MFTLATASFIYSFLLYDNSIKWTAVTLTILIQLFTYIMIKTTFDLFFSQWTKKISSYCVTVNTVYVDYWNGL